MAHQFKIVQPRPANLGEGPCWDEDNKLLYWVDVTQGEIHSLNLQTDLIKTIDVGQKVGAFALSKSGGAIIAAEHGFYLLDLETEQLTHVTDPEAHLVKNRFNDGKCDARGRFWAGTMSMMDEEGEGALYCLEPDLTVRKVLGNVSTSNGITWSLDNQIMYYIDSNTRKVMAYDYQLETGEISNPRIVIQFTDDQGYPDGMTIDAEGMLWIAQWGAYKVSRWNPANGTLLDEIQLPVSQVSSCVFGGDHLDQLYITSAREGFDAQQIAKEPLAGAVFSVQLGVKGIPMYKFGK